MKIEWLSGLSDQNLVTNLQCYKDRQNRSSLLSISMVIVNYNLNRANVDLKIHSSFCSNDHSNRPNRSATILTDSCNVSKLQHCTNYSFFCPPSPLAKDYGTPHIFFENLKILCINAGLMVFVVHLLSVWSLILHIWYNLISIYWHKKYIKYVCRL